MGSIKDYFHHCSISPNQDTLSPAQCDISSFSWLSWASPRPPSSRRGPVVGSCVSTRRTPTDDTNWDPASLVAVVTVLNNWRGKTVVSAISRSGKVVKTVRYKVEQCSSDLRYPE